MADSVFIKNTLTEQELELMKNQLPADLFYKFSKLYNEFAPYKVKSSIDSKDLRDFARKFNEYLKTYDLIIDSIGFRVNSKSDEEPLRLDFFIIPKHSIEFFDAHGNKYKNILLVDVINYDKDKRVRMLIERDCLQKQDWLSFFRNDFNINNSSSYKVLIAALNNYINECIPSKSIVTSTGWFLKGSAWHYFNITCNNAIKLIETNSATNYKKIKGLFQGPFHRQFTYMISYLSLSLINNFLRERGLEPSFVLAVIGKQETQAIRMIDFVFENSLSSINFSPEESMANNKIYNLKDKKEMARLPLIFKDNVYIFDFCMNNGKKDIDLVESSLLRHYSNRYMSKTIDTDNHSTARLNGNPVIYSDVPMLKEYCLEVSFDNTLTEDLKCKLYKAKKAYDLHIVGFLMFLKNSSSKGTLDPVIDQYNIVMKNVTYDYNTNKLIASRVAWLILGYDLYLRYGNSIGTISDRECKRSFSLAYQTFINDLIPQNTEDILQQKKEKSIESDATLVFKTIYELFTKKNESFLEKGTRPESDNYIGWYDEKYKDGDKEREQPYSAIFLRQDFMKLICRTSEKINIFNITSSQDEIVKYGVDNKIVKTLPSGKNVSVKVVKDEKGKEVFLLYVDKLEKWFGNQ